MAKGGAGLHPTREPMSETYIHHDDRFRRLIIGHAKLEHLWTGGRWVEGPVYVPSAKAVIWSDIPNDRLLRFDEVTGAVSVWQHPCGYHNGHTLDAEGRIVACEHGGRRISRLDFDGVWRTLIGDIDGKRLNSPNDVVVHSDGSIWFTDPTYGIDSHYEGHRAAAELDACNVYRFDPANGTVTAVVTDLLRPNGLCFSPDEAVLYVSDTGGSHDPSRERAIYSYAVTGDVLASRGLFAVSPAGSFDGIRADTGGNIWASTADGVVVYAPDATMLGAIPVPEIVSNLCFIGEKRNRVFITAQTSVYAIYVNAHAAGWTD